MDLHLDIYYGDRILLPCVSEMNNLPKDSIWRVDKDDDPAVAKLYYDRRNVICRCSANDLKGAYRHKKFHTSLEELLIFQAIGEAIKLKEEK